MSLVHSFKPIADHNARVLILGSMPGRDSLAAQRYYAHSRNAFWPIMASLYGFDESLTYAQRVAHLIANGVAVWDVLRSCERATSLDADIVDASIEVNDFAWFFSAHPRVVRIFFNGAKAQTTFEKFVIKPGIISARRYALGRLPSTSPAHASVSVAEKIEQWRVLTAQ